MLDINNILNIFDSTDNSKDDEVSSLIDFSEHPLFWIGGYNKIVNNYTFFFQYSIKNFKDILKDDEDLVNVEKATKQVLFNKAWEYIQNINVSNIFHVECIKLKSSDSLIQTLDLGIKFFEEKEEFEKCALLKNIQDIAKGFII
jgi:hypothetical protein